MHNEDVFICTLICRRTSYVLDLFLANQHEIQLAYPNYRLVLATDEPDYANELRELILQYDVKGDIIVYETKKPEYAKSRIWSITCGREALRKFVLANGAEYLMFMDADMTYDPNVIDIVKAEIQNFDVIYSGFITRYGRSTALGGGCTIIGNKILNKISFRCREFKNGQIIDEFDLLDFDLFRCHARIKKGILFANKHYNSRKEHYDIQPRKLSRFRMFLNKPFIRYAMVRINILIHRNITFMASGLFGKLQI